MDIHAFSELLFLGGSFSFLSKVVDASGAKRRSSAGKEKNK